MTNQLLKAAGITPGDIDFAAERAQHPLPKRISSHGGTAIKRWNRMVGK